MKLIELERITSQTLLGIRFWDPVLSRSIGHGLVATAQRLSNDRANRLGRPVKGFITPSSVIAFKGLSEAENLPADTPSQLWDTLPPAQLVVVDVYDTQGRYLPMSFVVQLPQRRAWSGRGAWQTTPLIRPIPIDTDDDQGVMLWSSATREIPTSFAIIRAQIVHQDGTTETPASFALVEVNQHSDFAPPDTTFNHFGIADQNGILTLILPYPPVPPPDPPAHPSDPEPVYRALDAQTYTLDFTIRYDAVHQTRLPDSPVPNLEQILTQPSRQIGTHWDTPALNNLNTTAILRTTLQYGKPLILQTRIGAVDADVYESVLRIQ